MLQDDTTNYTLFRDCFSSALMQRVAVSNTSKSKKKRATKGRKSGEKDVGKTRNEPEAPNEISPPSTADKMSLASDLADFAEFLAFETFEALPDDLQKLSYANLQTDPKLTEIWIDTPTSTLVERLLPIIPGSVTESLETYSLLSQATSFETLLNAALSEYLEAIAAPPPVWSATRATECEICDRDWVPLTYHHLIPKQVHTKVMKRGWHEEWMLNSVAWLCRACHSFIHRIATNEELAREWYTVERLLEREDVQGWSDWVGRVRWKTK